MEKTIKSLNLVTAALLIVNLGVELWDRFKPQMNKKEEKSNFDYSPSFDSEWKKVKFTEFSFLEKNNSANCDFWGARALPLF